PRPAAPEEVGRHDKPDEEVERLRPGRPGEARRRGRLRDEETGLRQPADTNAPRRQPPWTTWSACLARVGEGRLAVGDERGPEQQLSQPAPPPALPALPALLSRAPSRASAEQAP